MINESIKKGNSLSAYFLILASLLFATIACSKNSPIDENPELSITHSTEGLELTISGSAVDNNGTISEVRISWGDNTKDKLIYTEFSNINESHVYSNPDTYTITITATNSTSKSSSESIQVSMSFKETSLAGIKETMFKTSDEEFLVLTVNLHTYQEKRQNEKFNLITDVIGKMDIDFIAFQECAQNKSSTITEGIIREDNMALILSNSIKNKYAIDYNFIWAWAHYGWTVWEEGVAILSKYPLIESEDKYISTGTSVYNITSRKVIYGSYQIPDIGIINIFSAHLHWRTSETDEEQNNQIKRTKSMAREKEPIAGSAYVGTFICGDFNGNPTSSSPWSEGYNTMMLDNEYADSFLEAYPDANSKPAKSIYNTVGGDFPGRIDYIFMNNNSSFKVVDSQIIFTPDIVGKISDHYGVLTKVKYLK